MKTHLLSIVLFTFAFSISLTDIPEKIKTQRDFKYIPAGSRTTGDQVNTFKPFFMLNHEVTNGEYREFLDVLRSVGALAEVAIATPDTSAWNFRDGYMDPMVSHYFSHPAYAEYPAVNITKEGAELYCQYLTEKLFIEYGDGIMAKLPTSAQWMYAASGGFNRVSYSWPGQGLLDENGCYRANYYNMGDESITRDADGKFEVNSVAGGCWYDDGNWITAPSISYQPNEFGLFNMCGNVSELVGDAPLAYGGDWYSPGFDIRIESSKKVDKASPFVGFRPVIVFE